jgi:hypothetical protein
VLDNLSDRQKKVKQQNKKITAFRRSTHLPSFYPNGNLVDDGLNGGDIFVYIIHIKIRGGNDAFNGVHIGRHTIKLPVNAPQFHTHPGKKNNTQKHPDGCTIQSPVFFETLHQIVHFHPYLFWLTF